MKHKKRLIEKTAEKKTPKTEKPPPPQNSFLGTNGTWDE
jgi:hypothetical protein